MSSAPLSAETIKNFMYASTATVSMQMLKRGFRNCAVSGVKPLNPNAARLVGPAIAACAHYFGVSAADIQTVAIEYQEFKDARHEASVIAAENATRALARQFKRASVTRDVNEPVVL